MLEAIETRRGAIDEVCMRHRVQRLDAFGSALSDDFKAGESDLDLLVEFRPMDPYERVEAYFGLLAALRSLFDAEVDLVMSGALRNRYIAADVERTRQMLYAA